MINFNFDNFFDFYTFTLKNISEYNFDLIYNYKTKKYYSLEKIKNESKEIVLKDLSENKIVYLNNENTSNISVGLEKIEPVEFFQRYYLITDICGENEDSRILDFIINIDKIQSVSIEETFSKDLLRCVFELEKGYYIVYISFFRNLIDDYKLSGRILAKKEILKKIKEGILTLISKNKFFTL